jgi:hypothetical protein
VISVVVDLKETRKNLMSRSPDKTAQRRGRIQLLAMAALSLGRSDLAFWMYYGGHLIPGHKVNHGELIQPTRALPAAPGLLTPEGRSVGEGFLRRQWNPGRTWLRATAMNGLPRRSCGSSKKVRLAMDHERDRVHRVILGLNGCCTSTEIGPSDPRPRRPPTPIRQAGRQLLASLPAAEGSIGRLRAEMFMLVDPLGNLVMRFPADMDRKGLIRDLDKLLRLSHIG